jgi:Leucine-rich repeat (LRR) protein
MIIEKSIKEDFKFGKRDSKEEIKEELLKHILNEDQFVKISELEDITPQDGLIYECLLDFLSHEDYKLSIDNLTDFFYKIDILMDFLELEDLITNLDHFDEDKLQKDLKANLSQIDIEFLDSFSCGFDIAVRIINKYLGPKSLMSFLNQFERLENALALYTRQETLVKIEEALKLGLKSKEASFQSVASKVYKNGGLYFINLAGNNNFSYQLNKYITLKLENEKTNIYVNNSRFNQCKFLFLNIPVKKIRKYETIDSIDEAAEKLNRSMEGRSAKTFEISPATEFWGHCSNIQAWVENNYDTRILHRNLAFPLLKRLTEVGDPIAKEVFKEEILSRLESGYPTVVSYLCARRYVDYLSDDELRYFCEDTNSNFIENLIRNTIQSATRGTAYIGSLVRKFQRITEDHFKNQLTKVLTHSDVDYYRGFARLINPSDLNKNVLRALIFNPDSILRNFYIRCKGKDYFVKYSLTLNLCNKGIQDISEIKGLHRLKELKVLDLRNNNISEIKGLGNLVNLRRLRISGNPIPNKLLEELGGIDRLGKAKKPQKFVEYCRAKGVELSEYVIAKGKKHEVINKWLVLRDLGLKAISEIDGLDNIKELEMMDLSQNQITDINGIENIKSIKILNLQDNLLEDITSIEKLKNVEVLRLRGNNIINVKSLKSLKNLRILDIESKRKVDDRLYLSSLLQCMLVKEMKQQCRNLGITGHTKYTRSQMINSIPKALSIEDVRDLIYLSEPEIIKKGISNAIRKFKSRKRENFRLVKIINEETNEIELITNGHKRNYTTKFVINKNIIENPEHSCNCKDWGDQGLCDHFWMGLIFSLKLGYFKLEDWTLTPLPDDLQEKIKNIEFVEKDNREYRIHRKKQ